jgi:hypothetical protein
MTMTKGPKLRPGDIRPGDHSVVTQAEYDYNTALEEIEAIVGTIGGGRELLMRFDKAVADRFSELQDQAVREHCAKIRGLFDPVKPSYLL